MLYNNFDEFVKDQEKLILKNSNDDGGLNYLEGLLLMHDGPPDNWRSSFFPPSHHSTIISLVNQHSIIYCLEVAKYYDDRSRHTIDKVHSLIIVPHVPSPDHHVFLSLTLARLKHDLVSISFLLNTHVCVHLLVNVVMFLKIIQS